jgi:epoxide hydrolase-like predicted phosphatase
MTIRAVVFDIGGVLSLDEPMTFDRVWEGRLGLEPGAIGSAMGDVFQGGEIGSVTEAEVQAAMRERLGLTAAQVEDVLAEMWRQYLGVPNQPLIAYVKSLRPEFRTGILSNSFVGCREREQASFGVDDIVDDHVYSHEVGLRKPDPRLWRLTCDRFGVTPAEMVFVDNALVNVTSAREFGIAAVHFTDTAGAIAEIDAHLGRG